MEFGGNDTVTCEAKPDLQLPIPLLEPLAARQKCPATGKMTWREEEIYTQAAPSSSSHSNWDTTQVNESTLGMPALTSPHWTQFLANNPAECRQMSNPGNGIKKREKKKKCPVKHTHLLNSWPTESWANKNGTDVKLLNIRVVCWTTEDNKNTLYLN